jgi:protoporphyrinogen/coproporphyrinogen III oxidase
MKTVAIIGGGIAGLSLAEAIKRVCEQIQPIVFEAGARPGGKIATRTVDGFVVETGPHGFLDKEPAVRALIQRLGIADQLVCANDKASNRYVLRQSKLRLIPTKPPAFLFSDVLPLAARMRIMLEPWVAKSDHAVEESVHGFASRRLGVGAADVLLDAFVTGIYGGDPHRLSVASAFPRMVELEKEYGSLIRASMKLKKGPGDVQMQSFKNGLGTLIDALAQQLDVRCDESIKRIEKKGAVFNLHSTTQTVQADAVVLATPAFEAARLTRPLGKRFADTLAEIPYAPVSVVVQGFAQTDVSRPLDGFGFLVPGPEQRSVLGSIWASTVFCDHAPSGMVMFRTLLGGRRAPQNAQGSDEELAQRARLELQKICGLNPDTAPVLQEVIRWDKGIPQYEMDHREKVRAADGLEESIPGLFFAGNAYRGVAMIQCIAEAEKLALRIGNQLSL